MFSLARIVFGVFWSPDWEAAVRGQFANRQCLWSRQSSSSFSVTSGISAWIYCFIVRNIAIGWGVDFFIVNLLSFLFKQFLVSFACFMYLKVCCLWYVNIHTCIYMYIYIYIWTSVCIYWFGNILVSNTGWPTGNWHL